MTSQAVTTKVDKSEYDAHAALIVERLDARAAPISEKSERIRVETGLKIAESKRETIKWTVTWMVTLVLDRPHPRVSKQEIASWPFT